MITVKKYIKKPVEIQAIIYQGYDQSIRVFCPEISFSTTDESGLIHTLEGDMKVNPGDYIIKGIKGEFYPCKPDIFQETYTQVFNS